MPSGITILAPNGQWGGITIGWSVVGAATHWQANLTNDGDTSYSKFILYVLYTSNRLYYQDLMDGTNPPPHENITINKVTVHAVAKYVSGGFFPRGYIQSIIYGWPGRALNRALTSTYMDLVMQSYTSGLTPITITDVNDIETYTKFASFSNIANARTTQQYIEVEWETNTTVHIKGGHIKGGSIATI